jgi:Carboxypeptidase regulatory-like domain
MLFRRTFFVALALVLFTAMQLNAQSLTQGNVRGTVTDPSGAVVPGATVTLKNTANGFTETRTSTGSGFYEFALLPPGNYTVAVSAPNYKAASRTVNVSVGQVTVSNVQLAVATSNQTVEVVAQGSVLQAVPQVSTTMSQEQIEFVPNGAGDLSYIAQTSPGTSMNTQGGYGNFSTFGLGGTTNNFTVNSAPENDPFLSLNNSGATNVLLGQNDVGEATVVNNGYSGQYFSSGANVNYVTKSGTNKFHGNAIWYWNGRAMNANNYFNKQNSPPTPRGFVNDNQWAASVGGPIVKNKSFFFVDTEGLRVMVPVSRTINLPTTAWESAVLANVSAVQPTEASLYQNMFNLWNGAPGAASATNSLPGGGCQDFTGAGFGAANPCAQQLHSTVSTLTHEWLLTGRYDQNFNENDKMFIHFRSDHGLQATYTDPLNPILNATSNQPQNEGQLQWTHSQGANIVNSFTVNGSHYSAIFTYPNLNATLAAQPVEVAFSGGALYSVGRGFGSFPQGRNVTQYGFVDDLSWTAGRNTLKFGGNYSRYDISDFDPGAGSLPVVAGESMTDFYNGVGSLYFQSFPVRLSQPVALWNLGFYGEDRFHMRNNFDVTLTFRSDYNSNPVCQTNCFSRFNNNFSNIDHGIGTPYNQSIAAGLHQALPSGYHPWSLQPRLGFTWQPWTSTVVSGGFGLFSSIIPAFYVDSLMNNLPYDPSFVFAGVPFGPTTPGNGQSTAAAAAAALSSGFSSGATLASLTASVPGFSAPNFFNVAKNIHVPRTQEWNLKVEQSFGTKTALSLQYVGNHGIWQQINNGGINAYCDVSCLAALGVSSFNGLPATPTDPRFLQVTESSVGYNSNYNGLVVSLLRRLSAFQFQLNYTWSHALDYVSNGGQQLPYNFNTNLSITNPQNPFNVFQNMYGNADYDVRHNFTGNFVYTSPVRHGWLSAIGDWTIGATAFWHTGLPFTVVDSGTGSVLSGYGYGGVQAGGGGLTTFADQTGGSGIVCGSQYASLNTSPCPGMANNFTPDTAGFGNQRRNQLRGPRYFDTDLTLMKNFHLSPLGEAGRISFGITAFNVFNHPNFDQPVGDVADPSFGTIYSTVNPPTSIYGAFLGADASPRLLQTQIRISF